MAKHGQDNPHPGTSRVEHHAHNENMPHHILGQVPIYMYMYCKWKKLQIFMPVSDVNSEEACQIAVSQAMKHMRPDSEPEILNAEDHFATEATHSEVRPIHFAC